MAASWLEQTGLSMSGHILKTETVTGAKQWKVVRRYYDHCASRCQQGAQSRSGMGETKQARCSVVASAAFIRFEWLRFLKQVGGCLARWPSTTNTCCKPTRWPSKTGRRQIVWEQENVWRQLPRIVAWWRQGTRPLTGGVRQRPTRHPPECIPTSGGTACTVQSHRKDSPACKWRHVTPCQEAQPASRALQRRGFRHRSPPAWSTGKAGSPPIGTNSTPLLHSQPYQTVADWGRRLIGQRFFANFASPALHDLQRLVPITSISLCTKLYCLCTLHACRLRNRGTLDSLLTDAGGTHAHRSKDIGSPRETAGYKNVDSHVLTASGYSTTVVVWKRYLSSIVT
jgi:hypothetical protein